MSNSSLIKSPEAIEKMRVAGKLAAEVLTMIGEYVRPGITTDELNTICHDYIVNKQKAIPACLGYKGFPKSICTSINHQVCHGIPGPKVLKKGDIVNVDVTVIKNGYHGDTSKMFLVGNNPKNNILGNRLMLVAQECMYFAIAKVKPGARLGDTAAVIEAHAKKNRFSVVHEYGGHGIGAQFHEDPMVLHYGKAGTGMELQPGMTFTIEPMINAGKRFVTLLGDDWTVVTKDRKLSAQWEHTVLVTQDGVEILTLRDEEKEIVQQYR